AGFVAVDQGDGVFDFEAAELVSHGRGGEQLDAHESLRVAGLILVLAEVGLLLPLQAERSDAGVDWAGLWADDSEALGDRAFVDELDDDWHVAALLKLRGSWSAEDFDA